MSEYFDAEDPFADLTADDLSILEQQAHAATQASQHSQRQRQPPQQPAKHQHQPAPMRVLVNRATSFNQPISLVQEDPVTDDDYAQFSIDDQDLIIDDSLKQPSTPPAPLQRSPAYLSRFPTNIDQIALMQELASLRAETARLKAERERLETHSFTQDGKLDHLQRTLARTREDHESALARIQRATEADKQALQGELAERDRRLAALSADIEFQKNELREAREMALRGPVVRPPASSVVTVTNGEGIVSPRRPRVVKGSGVKSPEKSKGGAWAFGREQVGPVENKKRKRDERMVTPEPITVPVVAVEEINESEITKLVLERVLKERSSWTASDERFQVRSCFGGSRLTSS